MVEENSESGQAEELGREVGKITHYFDKL